MKRSNIIIIIFGIIFIGIILVLTNAPIPFLGEPGSLNITDDEYAVYSAFITQEYNKDYLKILLSRETKDCSGDYFKGNIFSMNKGLPTLQYVTYNNFHVRNMNRANLSYGSLPPTVLFLDDDEIKLESNQIFLDTMNNYDRWMEPRSRLPIIIQVSRVGFNLDKSQALLYTSSYCGGTCGSGDYYVFSKINGNWSISDHMMTWIS